MKRWLAVLLSFTMILAFLSACGDKAGSSDTPDSRKASEEAKASGSGDGEKENEEQTLETERDGVLKVASVNPFEKSNEGASLVFDYMTHLDGNYNAHPYLITE